MHRQTTILGLLAFAAALTALSAAGSPAKVRNGQISFWSDRAFGGRAQVFVMNPDGSRQRRLTNLYSAKRGDWSPDGRQLVIDGRDHETLDDFDIFAIRADGSGLRKITSGPERDTQATWSPDAQFIAFARVQDAGGGAPSLWMVGANGTNEHRATAAGSGGSLDPPTRTSRRTSLPTAAGSSSRATAAASDRSTR